MRRCLLTLLLVLLAAPAQAEDNCALLNPLAGMIGDWYVLDAGGIVIGISEIRAGAGGCALVERWRGDDGLEGEMLIAPAGDGRGLRMTWIDSEGLILELDGTASRDLVRFAGTHATRDGPVHHRIEWRDAPEAAFLQRWEYSTDGGNTWALFFMGWYVDPEQLGLGE
jgi:hypothetical protein